MKMVEFWYACIHLSLLFIYPSVFFHLYHFVHLTTCYRQRKNKPLRVLPLRVGGSEGGRNGDATAVGSHLLVGFVRTHKIHKLDSFRNQCDETLLDLGSCCLSTGLQDTGVLCGCVSTPQEIMAQFCYRFRQGLLPSALAHMSTSQFPWMQTWCRPKFLCIMEST